MKKLDKFSVTTEQFDAGMTETARDLDAQAANFKVRQHALAMELVKSSSLMTMGEAMIQAGHELSGGLR